MPRDLRAFLLLLAVWLACTAPRSLSAQTITPSAVRFEGAPNLNQAELQNITGLHPGVLLTKQQIDAGMQKLIDSGSFANVTYTVRNNEVTFTLVPAEGAQMQPVRFTNFVWWQPDDLLALVESRVPLFHGQLPLNGDLTDQVEAALVDLLREKGIQDARVTTMQSTIASHGGPSVALSIYSPQILVGETHFEGEPPELTPKLTTLARKLAGQDFDNAEIAKAVQQSSAEIFEDAGYLDIANDPPTLSPPRKDLDHYVIDEQVTLHPGTVYRVGGISFNAVPPLTEADLRNALTLKTGDVASALELRLAMSRIAQAYRDRAFLAARADAAVQKNAATHTLAYTFTFTPGAQFHFAAADTSNLSPALQAQFSKSWHPAPGTLADQSFQQSLLLAVRQLHGSTPITINSRLNNADHTVTVVLTSTGAPRS